MLSITHRGTTARTEATLAVYILSPKDTLVWRGSLPCTFHFRHRLARYRTPVVPRKRMVRLELFHS